MPESQNQPAKQNRRPEDLEAEKNEVSKSYYYDDSTGYEVYDQPDEDDDGNEDSD